MSDPQKYRSRDELEEFKGQDPIEKVLKTIKKNKWLTEDELAAIDEDVKQHVQESVEFAEESPLPEASELYTDVYSEPGYPYIMD